MILQLLSDLLISGWLLIEWLRLYCPSGDFRWLILWWLFDCLIVWLIMSGRLMRDWLVIVEIIDWLIGFLNDGWCMIDDVWFIGWLHIKFMSGWLILDWLILGWLMGVLLNGHWLMIDSLTIASLIIGWLIVGDWRFVEYILKICLLID